jgi:hypothetical protein
MVDLSIIIVNFNTKDLTREGIDSIVKTTKEINLEIIVVDNASKDSSVAMLEEYSRKLATRPKFASQSEVFRRDIGDNSHEPTLRLIKNRTNFGFAKGNNQGIKKARGRYILLLNTDTKLSSNVLGEMISWMDKNPKVGVASCALRNKDGSLQGTGGHFPDLFRVFAWMFFLEDIPLLDRLIKPFHPMHGLSPFYKGEGLFTHTKQQDWVTGAFFLTRKKVLDEVGFLDEDYFMYMEEVDLCYRIKKSDWQVWYLPDWSIVHYGAASSTAEFPILSEYKSMKLFYKKHKSSWQFPVLRIFLKGGALARLVIFGLLRGGDAAKTYAKAYKVA